jgi:hypothetical protein
MGRHGWHLTLVLTLALAVGVTALAAGGGIPGAASGPDLSSIDVPA